MESTTSKRLLSLMDDYISVRSSLINLVYSQKEELFELTRSDYLAQIMFYEEDIGNSDEDRACHFLGLLTDKNFDRISNTIYEYLNTTDQNGNDFTSFRNAVNELIDDYLILLNSFPPEFARINQRIYERFKEISDLLSFSISDVLAIRHDSIYV